MAKVAMLHEPGGPQILRLREQDVGKPQEGGEIR